jgi:DNA-binding XRE family transcriptional regulator
VVNTLKKILDPTHYKNSKTLEPKLGNSALKDIRKRLVMSRAELARKVGVSPITIDRIEKGKGCRIETKRKILLGLGYELSDKEKVFPERPDR